jgi:hypothetical protein
MFINYIMSSPGLYHFPKNPSLTCHVPAPFPTLQNRRFKISNHPWWSVMSSGIELATPICVEDWKSKRAQTMALRLPCPSVQIDAEKAAWETRMSLSPLLVEREGIKALRLSSLCFSHQPHTLFCTKNIGVIGLCVSPSSLANQNDPKLLLMCPPGLFCVQKVRAFIHYVRREQL